MHIVADSSWKDGKDLLVLRNIKDNPMEQQRRKLPVGLQSFEKMRQEGYLYVDKTDIVWRLANGPIKYNYLCHPRRFGKSILVDTLECYFTGKKGLFEGLKIMQLEKAWTVHPVIRLDMSLGGDTADDIRKYLSKVFARYETRYHIPIDESNSLSSRFDLIIQTAYEQTGQRVVVLIDEYDSPLLYSWRTPHHEECAALYRAVFTILKADDFYVHFILIASITKFTQLSLCSGLNNLSNISFRPEYASLCGITEDEITEYFQPELQKMSEANGWTMHETRQRLKDYYNGYHFSEDNMVDVYNPFTLINAMNDCELRNYWVSSGATSLLPQLIDDAEIRMNYFDHCFAMRDQLAMYDVSEGGPELFLYQSGYLTIKECDEFGYVLGFPNTEVRQALYEEVLPALAMRPIGETKSIQARLAFQLGTAQLPEAMKSLKSLIADVPYSNTKLASMDMDERYRLIISTILNALGYRVEADRTLSDGRIDLVAWTSRYIYVIKLHLSNNGGDAAAAEQIRSHNYLDSFRSDARKPIGLAIGLDYEGKGLTGWQVVE